MALEKAFKGSYQSLNITDYYFEIWVENWSSISGTVFDIKAGQGGPVICYDSDSDDRFNPILSSTCKIPLVIENQTVETAFVNKLYDTFQEKDVYFHLYKGTSSNYSSNPPLWSGFILMDLSERTDVSFPYDINLTATDGISILKSLDWTDEDSFSGGSPPSLPYDSGDVNWGPANFDFWLRGLLKRTGMALTTEGASANWQYSTSINWYNQGHAAPSVSNDPFKMTKGKMSWTHEKTSDGNFVVNSCYDALKMILRCWGARLTYWNHTFYIVQVASYDTAESGTVASPTNITSRIYTNAAASVSNNTFLGDTGNVRYELEINNANLTNGVPDGILLLKGTKFTHYPRLKQVDATFVYGGQRNYFGGFPEYCPTAASVTSTTAPTDIIVSQESIIDAYSISNFRLNFNLDMTHDSTFAATSQVRGWQRFTIRAFNDAGTEKFLKTTGTNQNFTWENSEPGLANMPLIEFSNVPRTTFASIPVFDEVIPTDSALTGLWHFEIKLKSTSWPASGNWTSTGFFASSQAGGNQTSRPYGSHRVRWRNSPSSVGGAGNFTSSQTTNASGQLVTTFFGNQGNPFYGFFQTLGSSGGQNAGAVVIQNTVATDDSEKYNFGELYYGDTFELTDEACLEVSDDGGSTFTKTALAGEWGEGTNSGSTKFTQLLVQQFFSGQTEHIQIINGRLATSFNGKTTTFSGSQYPNYVNPVGRLKYTRTNEGTNFYVFRRGMFFTASDEWEYEAFVIQDESVSLTTTTRDINSAGFQDNANGGGSFARMIAPPTPSNSLASEQVITTTSAQISGASVTSISIDAIGTAIFKSGDSLKLIDITTGFEFSLTVGADQGASDTSITISSFDFSIYPEIEAGALIYLNTLDLTAQYQHKTKGTIGGMAVTSNSLDGASKIGRETVFFRFEGDNLSETTYYVSNGEDNNKSGRWGSTNSNAPSTIGTQRAIKSGRFVADADYTIEAGTCVASGSSGYTVDITLYKTTPVDGSTSATAMTSMGRFSVALNTDARTQVDTLGGLSTAQISAGDIIVPHIYCGGSAGGTFDLRGLISFTLIRKTVS